MRLTSTTPLNDCIKRIADGDTGAATVIALILRDHPNDTIKWLRLMDKHGIYGNNVWAAFKECRQNLKIFLDSVANGSAAPRKK